MEETDRQGDGHGGFCVKEGRKKEGGSGEIVRDKTIIIICHN